MNLSDLNIKPGIYTIDTDRGSKGRYKDGNWVRFFKGLPEKIGGFQKASTSTFVGVCRGLTDWSTLAQQKLIGIGTHLRLYFWDGSAFYNVTPLRSSGTLGADPFSMTNLSTTVTVTHASHGASDGDYVIFDGASAAGGITIDGEYVLDYIDANSYTITHSAAATSTTTGGGAAVTYEYEISVGQETSVPGFGWGAGAYSESTYGTARSASNILAMARVWSFGQWGEDLIACPRGGGIYAWDATSGTSVRAAVISQAPTTAKAIFVTDANRTIVALGAHDGSANDPMLVRWCDEEDYTIWTADEDNTAGEKRLDAGNELYCRVRARKEDLIFSDSFVWSMTFEGPPYTFGFAPLGQNGGIRGPNAAVEKDGRVYWMARKEFYIYDGAIRVLPCDVLNYVMDDIRLTQGAKVFAGVNRLFNEVWWLYCSGDADECDRYVLYNTEENTWAYGDLERTAMVGDSDIFQYPYMTDPDSYLYDHEFGVNAGAGAQSSFLQSADIEIGEGEHLMLLTRMVPDFERLTGSIDLTATAKKWPQDSDSQSESAISITSSTKFINPRIKGRQISIRLESDAVDDDWRMGMWRVGAKRYGKK